MFNHHSFLNIYLASDFLVEIKALIDKHVAKQRNGYIWYKELGKDLINYVSRPDFLLEAFHHIRTYGEDILYSIVIEFLSNITEAQIKSLIENKFGWTLIDEIQGWLTVSGKPFDFPSVDRNLLAKFNTKIESVRIPIVVNDKRPYIGNMVAKDEDLGIDTSRFPQRIPFYTYRFGGAHDGEHWLTKSIGAEVRATAEIRGIVLTYYFQGEGLWSVMIWLEKTNAVLLLKDLVTLGTKIKQEKIITYPDNEKTKKNETIFTDNQGRPISNIKLENGDLIGTTMPWNNGNGTFHFALLKYEKAQEFRTRKSKGANIADNNLISKLTAEANLLENPKLRKQALDQIPFPLDWFIPVLSPQSPIKCFK